MKCKYRTKTQISAELPHDSAFAVRCISPCPPRRSPLRLDKHSKSASPSWTLNPSQHSFQRTADLTFIIFIEATMKTSLAMLKGIMCRRIGGLAIYFTACSLSVSGSQPTLAKVPSGFSVSFRLSRMPHLKHLRFSKTTLLFVVSPYITPGSCQKICTSLP
jgi:hypothetical protein